MTSGDSPTPLLTVFTPFYNNIEYFDECIASVLSQSFRDFEYLMVNDGDPENARRIERVFKDPRIRIINTHPPLGLSGSRNFGLQQARGELIAFIDSDDFCEPGRFGKQVEFLAAHPDHILVGTALRYVDTRSQTIGGRVYPLDDQEIKSRLIVVNCVAQPSVMARREALIEAGGYTNDFPCAEDYALWLRLARYGKFHNLAEPLVAYRIHEQSGKHVLLKPALRDTTRLKIHAIRHYGFKATPAALASIALHCVLLLLPARLIFWLFKRLVVAG
jgi:cellulose synthase/poly-beta-1,6-N-acetylglucosamine synthase-like glycosyltransferase